MVHFDLPEAYISCGVIRIDQIDGTGLTSGSVFPIGTTTLTYRASGAAGSATCSIDIEVLPDLKIHHQSGIGDGDTLHIADCRPPQISKDDLDLGRLQRRSSLQGSVFSQNLDDVPAPGLWKLLHYTYKVEDQCGQTGSFGNYVALYDIQPPIFMNFPNDITIESDLDLPPVATDVRILDICRFVVWDTVITVPVIHPENGDTTAYVRRWMAEDEVGNRSFRDQMIYIRSEDRPVFNSITAHIISESDLVQARFPGYAGTNEIPVSLFRIDTTQRSTIFLSSLLSGNWQGSQGRVNFTPLFSGSYQMQIAVPEGYMVSDPDSVFQEDGWSDPLYLSDGTNLDLGSILLLPIVDTVETDTILPIEVTDIFQEQNNQPGTEKFTIYPNPAQGIVHINVQNGESIDFTIFNHLGQIVRQGNAQGDTEIDLYGQPDGMYFIRSEAQRSTRKFLLIGKRR